MRICRFASVASAILKGLLLLIFSFFSFWYSQIVAQSPFVPRLRRQPFPESNAKLVADAILARHLPGSRADRMDRAERRRFSVRADEEYSAVDSPSDRRRVPD